MSQAEHDRRIDYIEFGAADIEATIAAVKEAGAAIPKDIFSFPGGRRFHLIDPNGDELAVWSDR